jgi:hypothetical protein
VSYDHDRNSSFSERDREREREKEKERDREKEKERERERVREREKDRRLPSRAPEKVSLFFCTAVFLDQRHANRRNTCCVMREPSPKFRYLSFDKGFSAFDGLLCQLISNRSCHFTDRCSTAVITGCCGSFSGIGALQALLSAASFCRLSASLWQQP